MADRQTQHCIISATVLSTAKTLRDTSHNTIGYRDNAKVLDTVFICCPWGKSSLSWTKLQVLVFGLYVVENFRGHAFCRHSMIITITMRVDRDEAAKEFFVYESASRRNLLICMNYLRKSFVFQLTQHQWNASELFMQPHCGVLSVAWATSY